jgi:serine/threonine protein kinase
MTEDNSTLGSYELVEEIGRGGFGTVFGAIKKTFVGDFQFAIKILEPDAFVDESEPVEDRFRREVLVIQKLKHRAIISYIDAGFDRDDKPYFVMPLIEGKDLRDTTAGRPLLEIIDLFQEVLDGLTMHIAWSCIAILNPETYSSTSPTNNRRFLILDAPSLDRRFLVSQLVRLRSVGFRIGED